MTKSISLFAFDAENGDCLLLINNETQFSILIDSGPKSSSVTERIFNNIRAIIGNKAIDLAIVTHNDDDHIGGFKRLLKKGLMIKSYIFNHHDVINKILVNSRNKKVSIRQDIELEKVIKDKVVSLELTTSGYFNSVNYDVFNITFRSPNKDRLEDYSKWLEKEKKRKNIKVSSGDTSLSIAEHIEESNSDDNFSEDKRAPNGSSLALDISFFDYRVLLLGDAYPSTVINSYKNEKSYPIKYDLVKISHHGSSKNTNNKLLNLFDCDNYLICSNANNKHNHPSPTTLFRLKNLNCNNIYLTKNSIKVDELEHKTGLTFTRPKCDYLEFEYGF